MQEIAAEVQLFVSTQLTFPLCHGPFPTGPYGQNDRPFAPMLKRSGLIPDRHQ